MLYTLHCMVKYLVALYLHCKHCVLYLFAWFSCESGAGVSEQRFPTLIQHLADTLRQTGPVTLSKEFMSINNVQSSLKHGHVIMQCTKSWSLRAACVSLEASGTKRNGSLSLCQEKLACSWSLSLLLSVFFFFC